MQGLGQLMPPVCADIPPSPRRLPSPASPRPPGRHEPQGKKGSAEAIMISGRVT